MKVKKFWIVSIIMISILACVGCSGIVEEKDIKKDLETFSNGEFLQEGEVIDKIKIEKRDTDKDNNNDTIWCDITVNNSKMICEKGAVLYYHKYDAGGWKLEKIDVQESSKWIITPLKGITKEDIPSTLIGKTITVDGEEWEILENEISEIKIGQQTTELEKKTDKVEMDITLEGEVESVKIQLTVNYKFDKQWGLDIISEEKAVSVEILPQKEFNINEEQIVRKISEEKIPIQVGGSTQQEITINKDEVSDFKIVLSSTLGTLDHLYISQIN